MPLLGVNIDHVATLRQARYRAGAGSGSGPASGGGGAAGGWHDPGEPDPVAGAHEAELGGAQIITVHLREDRRHIQDRDVARLIEACRLRVNLEMAATAEMVGLAASFRGRGRGPEMATLVPEGRHEVTTEGGLDVAGDCARLTRVVAELHAAGPGMTVSAFIDADPEQVKASRAAGFDACEFHTGPYAEAFARAGGDFRLGTLAPALERLGRAGEAARAAGMRFHAGHALNYANVGPVASLAGVEELHIGHSIVSRAVFVGLRAAVSEMRLCIERGLPAGPGRGRP